jgi:predicted secreted protein
MKHILSIILILSAFVVPSFASTKSDYDQVRDFLVKCKNEQIVPLLNNIDTDVKMKYLALPEIQPLKEQSEKASEILGQYLLQNPEYSKAHEEIVLLRKTDREKGNKLWEKAITQVREKYKDDPQYQELATKRLNSFYEFHAAVFTRIVNDYEKADIPFPMRWIENNGFDPDGPEYPVKTK